ncbi:phospholipase A1-like [Ornithodoros turicata]|uniref:phospholipase A1-like n=1 Tax=Ornithodoros turicata TaxID=34597 RepID=UPI003138FFE9
MAILAGVATTLFATALLCLCPLFADGASCTELPKAKRIQHAARAVQRAPFGTFNTTGNWSYLVPRKPDDVQVTFVIYRNGFAPIEYRIGGNTRYLTGILNSSITIICHDLPKNYRKEAVVLINELLSHKKSDTLIYVRWNVGDCEAKTTPGDFYYCPAGASSSNADFYQQAAGDSRLVARQAARFLSSLVYMHDWTYKLDSVHFIGFGIGAHIGAFLAEELSSIELYLGRLTALDPARFLFEDTGLNHLSRDSASFVDVVHTSDCHGLVKPVGHVDFYVNGGGMQPGCTDAMCSHVRALSYYTSSIAKCDMVAYAAPDYDLNTSSSIFGYRSFLNDVTGLYYLKTKPNFPYCSTDDSTPTPTSITSRSVCSGRFAIVLMASHFLLQSWL